MWQTYRQSIRKSYEQGSDTVQLILCPEGLEIGKNFETNQKIADVHALRQTKLCCMSAIDQRTQDMVRWVDREHRLFTDPTCNKFILKPVDNSDEKFIIEMPYGDLRPKLISYNNKVIYTSQIACSSK